MNGMWQIERGCNEISRIQVSVVSRGSSRLQNKEVHWEPCTNQKWCPKNIRIPFIEHPLDRCLFIFYQFLYLLWMKIFHHKWRFRNVFFFNIIIVQISATKYFQTIPLMTISFRFYPLEFGLHWNHDCVLHIFLLCNFILSDLLNRSWDFICNFHSTIRTYAVSRSRSRLQNFDRL